MIEIYQTANFTIKINQLADLIGLQNVLPYQTNEDYFLR